MSKIRKQRALPAGKFQTLFQTTAELTKKKKKKIQSEVTGSQSGDQGRCRRQDRCPPANRVEGGHTEPYTLPLREEITVDKGAASIS